MSGQIRVSVFAADPVSEAGIVGQLRHQPDLAFLPNDPAQARDVAVVVADLVDEHMIARFRQESPVVLVIGSLDGPGVLAAVGAGVTSLILRSDATPERLGAAIRGAARGGAAIPSDLLGLLLRRSAERSPRLTYGGLTGRELTVLRLVADGYSTTEIAQRLAYSERTVKNALHDLTSRFQLRNRSHAVAFALREGLI